MWLWFRIWTKILADRRIWWKKARIGRFAYPYSPPSVGKCMKSWLAQGSSGRRVTLLPRTTFLHINGALEPINIWGIRKKKKEGDSEKGGRKFTRFTSPGSAPDILTCEDMISSHVKISMILVISSLSLKSYLNSLMYHRNIKWCEVYMK